MGQTKFNPGFRFSVTDGCVLATGIVVFALMPTVHNYPELEFAIKAAVGCPFVAFFLFCNVFRVCRRYELAWAMAFVTLFTCTILFGMPAWYVSVALATLLLMLVVVLQMSKPSYHGVGWKRINPALPEWWAEQNLSAA